MQEDKKLETQPSKRVVKPHYRVLWEHTTDNSRALKGFQKTKEDCHE